MSRVVLIALDETCVSIAVLSNPRHGQRTLLESCARPRDELAASLVQLADLYRAVEPARWGCGTAAEIEVVRKLVAHADGAILGARGSLQLHTRPIGSTSVVVTDHPPSYQRVMAMAGAFKLRTFARADSYLEAA